MNTVDRAITVERLVEAIEGRLDRSPLAVMLDIDGTLAPIAPVPGSAIVPQATLDVIRRLTELPAVHVAVVSGRSAADAFRMTEVDTAWIIGNHGFEVRPPHGAISAIAEVGPYEESIAKAATALVAAARSVPGTLVENKRWTLTLHHRLADPRDSAALIERARDVAKELRLRTTVGKRVLELRPPLDVNKGTAAKAFADRVGALQQGSMLYAGDDQTDEDAFRALKSFERRAVTVRVLERRDPEEVSTEAHHTLASPEDLRRALEWLLERRKGAAELAR